jgi:hypothetical protein
LTNTDIILINDLALLGVPLVGSKAQLPGDFGSDLHRVASAKTWLESRPYQWVANSRLLVWEGTLERPKARLVDPETAKEDPLLLFNHLYVSAYPLDMGTRFDFVSPDGKSVLSLLGGFMGPITFYRNLSLDGYRMFIQPFPRLLLLLTKIAWEWNDHYHGLVMMGSLHTEPGVQAILHYDLSNPENVRVVKYSDTLLPAWTAANRGYIELWGVTAMGDGILAPYYSGLSSYPEWSKQHKIPVSLIDIKEGKQSPTNYLISIPTDASVKEFVFSPDARHIAWQLRYRKPHTIPGQATLYATDEIWISNLDGSNMHRLGYQAILDKRADEGLSNLAWKDNKTVSFILNKVLYALPLR